MQNNNDFSNSLQNLEREMQRLTQEHRTDEAKEKALHVEIPRLRQEIQELKKSLGEKEAKLKIDERESVPLHGKIQKIERDLIAKHHEFDQAKQRLASLAQSSNIKLR
jgi:chromosome segregation ATPase